MQDNLDQQFKKLQQRFIDGERDAVIKEIAKLFYAAEKKGAGNDDVKKILAFVDENPKIREHFISAQANRAVASNTKPVITCNEVPIHFLPRRVDINDIHSNGKLLSERQIEKVKKYFAENHGQERYSKKDLGVDYSVIKIGTEYFAIYITLGTGGQGKAKLIQNLDTGEWGSLKIYSALQEDLGKEFQLSSSKIEQENLVGMEKNIGKNIVTHQTFSQKQEVIGEKNGKPIYKAQQYLTEKYNIGMKFAYGVDMRDYFNNPHKISSVKYLQYGLNFLKAYKDQVKDKGYIHRDIKLENAILDLASGKVTIIDAGIAIRASESEQHKKKSEGTPDYKAPEIDPHNPDIDPNNKEYHYSEKSDIWALAISLAKMYDLIDEDAKDENGYPVIKILSLKESNKNQCFEDDNTRSKVIDFINEMLQKKAGDRISIEHAISKFEDILNQVPDVDKTRRVAIFDISEYLNAEASERSKIRANLKGADEVWMLDGDPESTFCKDPKAVLKLQRELEDGGILVGRRLFSNPNPSVKEGVYALLEKAKEEKPSEIRGFYFVTADKNLSMDETKIHVIQAKSKDAAEVEKNYQQSHVTVDSATISLLASKLVAEVSRLKVDYSDHATNEIVSKRIKLIENYTQELNYRYDNTKSTNNIKPITFGELQSNLKTLEKNMLSTGLGLRKSTGEKNIAHMREEAAAKMTGPGGK